MALDHDRLGCSRFEVGDITITLPGSLYSVTYYKPKTSPQLLAKYIVGDDIRA